MEIARNWALPWFIPASMLNNWLMYNAARCYEFCAHFPGSQKSPKIQTAADSSTFRVSYTNTRITAVCQKKKNRMTRK